MLPGLHAVTPHHRESLRPLMTQAFHTLALLAAVILIVGSAIAVLYRCGG